MSLLYPFKGLIALCYCRARVTAVSLGKGRSVAKFIVPDGGGGEVNSGIGLSCRIQLYPPVRDYEFGY